MVREQLEARGERGEGRQERDLELLRVGDLLDFADKGDARTLLARVLRVLDVERDLGVTVDVARVCRIFGEEHERLSVIIEQITHERACKRRVTGSQHPGAGWMPAADSCGKELVAERLPNGYSLPYFSHFSIVDGDCGPNLHGKGPHQNVTTYSNRT